MQESKTIPNQAVKGDKAGQFAVPPPPPLHLNPLCKFSLGMRKGRSIQEHFLEYKIRIDRCHLPVRCQFSARCHSAETYLKA